MKKTCPECGIIVIADESNYTPGEVVKIDCQLCGTTVEFTIPEKTEEPEPVPEQEPETPAAPIVGQRPNRTENELIKRESQTVNVHRPEAKHTVETHRPTPSKPTTPLHIDEPSKKGKGGLIGAILAIIAVAAVCGYYYYEEVYIPEKIDREAPRYYNFSNGLFVRSSKETGVDYNKVEKVPYGTEFITYSNDNEWCDIKVAGHNGSQDIVGYVAANNVLDPADFAILNSIFGDRESYETVESTKCRRALLDYFKANNYIGKMNTSDLTRLGIAITPNSDNQWQVFSRAAALKPKSVIFKRLINKNSKFTDFGVIIKNIVTGDRKFIYFAFDDDETPHFITEYPAPTEGWVVDARVTSDGINDYLNVDYDE